MLKTGVLTTLRLDDPQANQTLQCDPDYAQGQEFSAFRYGCKPWYGANPFTNGDLVEHHHEAVPRRRPVVLERTTMPAPFGKNSSSNPWRCVLTAPGMSTGQVGDDIAVATENCSNINSNSCQQFACNYDGNYDGKPSEADRVVHDRRPRRHDLAQPGEAGLGLSARREPVHRPVPGRQGADRRR